MRKTALILSLILTASLLAPPFGAKAINSDYISPNKWLGNPNTVTVPIELSSPDRELSGNMSYYTDDSLCIYTYFRITETTLSDENDNVYVCYDFHMPDEEYSVTVGADGIFEDEAFAEERDVFDVEVNFPKTGEYCSAVGYKGKKYRNCTVDIKLNVNGRVFNVTQNVKALGGAIYMEIPVEETTTKPAKEKKEKKEKKAKKSGKKSTYKNKNGSKTQRAKKEQTTKFKPQYNVTTKAKFKPSGAQSVSQNAEAASTVVEEILGGGTGEFSRGAKLFMFIGAILAGAGIAFLIMAAATKNKKNEKEENEEKEKEEKEKDS